MGLLDPPFRQPTKVQNWARSMRNPRSVFPVMAAPPTVTFGNGASTVNPSYQNGSTVVPSTDASRMTLRGSVFVPTAMAGGFTAMTPSHISNADGSKGSKNAPLRACFLTDANAVDFCFLDKSFSQFGLVIDRQFAARQKMATFTNTGNYRYIKGDFGADIVTYSKAQTAFAIAAQGTGYVVGDSITLNGGSGAAGGTPCTVKVTQVGAGGVVQQVDTVNPGNYTAQPTGTMVQTSTTGVGTGLQLTAQFFSPIHSTKAMRLWEMVWSEPAVFMGIVVPPDATVIALPENTKVPRCLFIGDSITIGTYVDYAAGHWAAGLAQRLDLWDNFIINGIGGTGYLASTQPWSSDQRIADFLSCAPEIVVIEGSQNDTGSDATQLKNAVVKVLNALLSYSPNLLIAGVGPIIGASASLSNNIKQGFMAASDQRRVIYIDNQSPYSWNPAVSNAAWTVTSDSNHPAPAGQDRFRDIQAYHVMNAFRSMAG